MNDIDVLVIGRSCLDYIAVVNQFPAENQKLPLEFRLTEGDGQGGTSSCCRKYVGRNGVPDWDQALATAETLAERGIESI